VLLLHVPLLVLLNPLDTLPVGTKKNKPASVRAAAARPAVHILFRKRARDAHSSWRAAWKARFASANFRRDWAWPCFASFSAEACSATCLAMNCRSASLLTAADSSAGVTLWVPADAISLWASWRWLPPRGAPVREPQRRISVFAQVK
jgi:hypothetical protein